jgi:general secretion pathway protein D
MQVQGRTPRTGQHRWQLTLALAFALVAVAPRVLWAQDSAAVRARGDNVALRFVDTDLRTVVAALARYLPKPVIVANVPPLRVTLETPGPVPPATVATLLKAVAESHGLEFHDEAALYRIVPKPQAPPTPMVPPPGSPGSPQGAIQLFVVRLKHARAADVAATVNQLFGGGGEFSGRSGFGNGTLSDELRRNAVPPAGVPAPGAGAQGGRTASLAGPVTIVPDALTNSLLVRASRVDYEVLQQAVEQLDIRPLQVLIEVLIVEARQDRNFALGANVRVPRQNLGGDQTAEGELLGPVSVGLGDIVLEFMNLGKPNIDAFLRLAQSRGDIEIVSRPVLVASNNTEARFLVGSQRPFIQVSRSLPTDTPSRDQVVQYKDVGTELTVRPTINQDGYVSLLIQQEINAATSETQFDAPVISTREAMTQVLVKDGQTIVIGGLRDQQKDRVSSGVPILSGIPIIGGLFGGQSRRTSRTELYLFLTPRIIRSDADVERVTNPRLPDQFRRELEQATPESAAPDSAATAVPLPNPAS